MGKALFKNPAPLLKKKNFINKSFLIVLKLFQLNISMIVLMIATNHRLEIKPFSEKVKTQKALFISH